MKQQRSFFFQVQDVEGADWDVRDARATKHGFDLLYGSPVSRVGACWTGLPRLIVTKPLYDFWDANRTKRDGVIYDLPAGRTTLKRARRRFGFHALRDLSRFWRARLDDLRTLSAREFAAKHGVKVDVVVDTRFRLLGRQARELGWWQDPDTLEVLQSGVTLREIGEKVGISISHAKRLRDRALQLQEQPEVRTEEPAHSSLCA